jgi:hypothetical protein
VRFGRSVPKGFLTVYNVKTEKEAKDLLVLACQTNLDGEFVARELVEEQTLENLDLFSQRLEKAHAILKQRTKHA